MRQQLDGTFAGRLPRPLRKLIGAGEEMHNSLAKGITASNFVLAMFDWLSATNSYVGLFLRSCNSPLMARPPGLAVKSLFPLPWLTPHSPMVDVPRQLRVPCRILVNIWVAFLNAAYQGTRDSHLCKFQPSVAQQRCLSSLLDRAATFLREVPTEELGG